jgi:HAD superfamily hydrolase (TIGR01484 family)
MRYLALAADYDGTLASHGRLLSETRDALMRLRESGRKLILVTGRELDELRSICPDLDLFELVVAENGAVVYRPSDNQVQLLAAAPPDELIDAIRRRGVDRLSLGRVILATWEPHETAVLEAIRDAGLEYHLIFNKGAVMVLPAGVTKATGLAAALAKLGLSRHNVVGVGDAENDHAFLTMCECSVAVSNAIDALKQHADLVTAGDHGAGVVELIEQLLADDLAALEPRLVRHHVLLGTADDGREVRIPPYGGNLLVAGSSGSGKSTLATAFVERLADAGYQVGIIDPEGDYKVLDNFVALGAAESAPTVDELAELLKKPDINVAVNLVGVRKPDRPTLFLSLFARVQEMRVHKGRPHWLVVDESHHVLGASREPASRVAPEHFDSMMFITVEPASLAGAVLEACDTVIAVGDDPALTLRQFSERRQLPAPEVSRRSLDSGEVLIWRPESGQPPCAMRILAGRTERRRHVRKYAEGDLGEDRSFYFRGPNGQLKLRAQNLMLFVQIAEGVDDATWMHHLRQGEYSDWFRQRIKDPAMADAAQEIERQPDITADESRAKIKELVERLYTLPASASGRGGKA